MTYLKFSFFILLFLNASISFAHGSHPSAPKKLIKASEAKQLAEKLLSVLINRKELGESWTGIKANDPEKKKFSEQLEWVVSFDNSKEKEKKKRKLYTFFSLYGELLGANFTRK